MSRKGGKRVVRVGNYTASLYELGGVPVIEVSNLGGTWMVRIPVDFQMYGIVNRLLLEVEDEDYAVSSNAKDWLSLFFMNWQNATGIPNGYYHQAITMLTMAYADPSLLKKSFFGRGGKFYSDVERLRKQFLKWSKSSDRITEENEKGYDVQRDISAEIAKEVSDGKVDNGD